MWFSVSLTAAFRTSVQLPGRHFPRPGSNADRLQKLRRPEHSGAQGKWHRAPGYRKSDRPRCNWWVSPREGRGLLGWAELESARELAGGANPCGTGTVALRSPWATADGEKEEWWQRGGPRGRPQQPESHTPGKAFLGSPPPSRGSRTGLVLAGWPLGWQLVLGPVASRWVLGSYVGK